MTGVTICTPHQILAVWSNQEEWNGKHMLAYNRKERNAHGVLLGKPEWKIWSLRLIHKCKDDIRVHFKVIQWLGLDWTPLAQHWGKWQAVVSMVTNLQVSKNVRNCWNRQGSCNTYVLQLFPLSQYTTPRNVSEPLSGGVCCDKWKIPNKYKWYSLYKTIVKNL